MGLSIGENKRRMNPLLEQAIQDIERFYGHKVAPRKQLTKYGTVEGFGTDQVLVMDWGADTPQLEAYPTTNSIAYVSSSSANDTDDVYYEYHTVDASGNLTFGTHTQSISGQTKTALEVPCARISRTRYRASGADADNEGDIYFYQDDTVTSGVPGTPDKIHLVMPANESASLKAATSFSQYDYFVITGITVGLTRNSGNGIGTFRGRFRVGTANFVTGWRQSVPRDAGPYHEPFDPYFILPPNSDAIVTVQGSTTALNANASFSGYICSIIGSPVW